MRIAILGATSMLAADFVSLSLDRDSSSKFTLFARRPEQIVPAMHMRGVTNVPPCLPLDEFSTASWDAIINFIGVGDPARAAAMGAEILQVTQFWDRRVLDYVERNPACRYIFTSSGAAFGGAAADVVGPESAASFEINGLQPSAYYGIAKFYSEATHRAFPDHSIIDVRIFNYLSRFADLTHRFLINEIIGAVRDGRTLKVTAGEMCRDYLGREDLTRLLVACLQAPPGYNGAIDAYSLAPTSKAEILNLFVERFGLTYEVAGNAFDATGVKSRYFSENREAATLGYLPSATSLETIERVADAVLNN